MTRIQFLHDTENSSLIIEQLDGEYLKSEVISIINDFLSSIVYKETKNQKLDIRLKFTPTNDQINHIFGVARDMYQEVVINNKVIKKPL
jgi:hypothetical protein